MKAGSKMVLLIALIVILVFAVVGCGSDKATNTRDIDYEIISKDDLSYGGAVRLSVDVVVNEETNLEELESISKEVLSEVKKDISLNALAINFYDYEEYIGRGGYTLGKTIYAPNGKWEDANTTSAGNYRYMDYDFQFRVKDWDNRLTREEVSIFKDWKDLLKDDTTEESATEQVSEKFNITKDEVDDIIMKQITWTIEDK